MKLEEHRDNDKESNLNQDSDGPYYKADGDSIGFVSDVGYVLDEERNLAGQGIDQSQDNVE